MSLTAIGVGAGFVFNSSGAKKREPQTTLQSIVDTVVPKDDFAGALDINIDQTLLDEMHSRPRTKERVERLIAAINKTALSTHRRDFLSLPLEQREQLLLSALESDKQATLRSDMHVVRRKVLVWYYASKEGQASLGYASPLHYPAYASSTPY